MGFLNMSSGFVPIMCSKFYSLGNNNGSDSPAAGAIATRGLMCETTNTATVGGRIAIMKGAVPTDFTGLTTFGARSSDLLVLFDASGLTSETHANQFATSQATANPAIFTSTYSTATGSGDATWFWWFTTTTAAGNVFSDATTIYNQIIGTVGATGSGADLIIPSVSVAAGDSIRVYDFRIQIPTSWTF